MRWDVHMASQHHCSNWNRLFWWKWVIHSICMCIQISMHILPHECPWYFIKQPMTCPKAWEFRFMFFCFLKIKLFWILVSSLNRYLNTWQGIVSGTLVSKFLYKAFKQFLAPTEAPTFYLCVVFFFCLQVAEKEEMLDGALLGKT